jgi:hyperosmotically inducible protein
MRKKLFLIQTLAVGLTAVLLMAAPQMAAPQKAPVQIGKPDARDVRRMEVLKEEVRHQLVTLPYYTVFDWLQADIKSDGTVTLMGAVTRPTLKSDAENRVKTLESATRVVNNIEVLPLSPMDDQLRVSVYRALFRYDSPLFRYGTQSVPPIHIILKNGHLTLKGVVANQMDSQLAQMAANGVSGIFEVKNELQIEQRVDEKVSRK